MKRSPMIMPGRRVGGFVVAVSALVACSALVGCSVGPVTLPGFGGAAPATPQICDALRNTASTGALGDKRSQENAVADMQKRGCPNIPKL